MNHQEHKSTGSTASADPLEFPWILPGLVGICAIVLIGFTRMQESAPWVFAGLNLSLFSIPWITLLVLRRTPAAYGYVMYRAIARYGWGMVAGGVWRGISMTINYLLMGGQITLGESLGSILVGLAWVPLIEETFYRGYLGRTLSFRYGRGIGIISQALLFTLHPYHWSQGWPAWLSILAFGILVGWMVERTGSLWIAWGAHGFANVLPVLVLMLSN